MALLLNLALAWSAGATPLAPARPGVAGGPEILPAATFHTNDPWVFLRWQVKSGDPEGTFRLYRGDSPATLQEIGETEAIGGVGTYRFFDARPLPGHAVYQLRYRSGFGNEVVLATIACERHQDASSRPAVQGSSFSALAVLTQGAELADPNLGATRVGPGRRAAIDQRALEPLEPPPDRG